MADPLADSVPSRHSLESDDEEDEYNPLATTSPGAVKLDVQITHNHQRCDKLVIAIGEAARSWIRGAGLGGQTGLVTLNAVPVGFLFNPPWTKTVVLVSEITTRLPSWAMHRYAEFVINFLQPSSLAFLDSYDYPSYISAEFSSSVQPSLRYLISGRVSSSLESIAQPFTSPNLIISTTASFLAILSLRGSILNSLNFTVILLPFSHVLPPPPVKHGTTHVSHLTGSVWPQEIMCIVHQCLFIAVEQTYITWTYENGEEGRNYWQSEKSRLVEQGMYI